MRFALTALALIAATAVAQAQSHPCAADAIAKATRLLCLHGNVEANESVAVEKDVKVLPPVKALKGQRRFDVFEVWGHIYKADYRMRFSLRPDQGLVHLDGRGDFGSERSVLSGRSLDDDPIA